jgi:hypothetical protein
MLCQQFSPRLRVSMMAGKFLTPGLIPTSFIFCYGRYRVPDRWRIRRPVRDNNISCDVRTADSIQAGLLEVSEPRVGSNSSAAAAMPAWWGLFLPQHCLGGSFLLFFYELDVRRNTMHLSTQLVRAVNPEHQSSNFAEPIKGELRL